MAKLADDFPHAQLLIDAGFGTEARVRNASDEDLLAIKHLGPDALEKIRAATGQAEQKPEGQVEEKAEEAGEAVEAEPEPVAWECAGKGCGHTITVSPCPFCGHVV